MDAHGPFRSLPRAVPGYYQRGGSSSQDYSPFSLRPQPRQHTGCGRYRPLRSSGNRIQPGSRGKQREAVLRCEARCQSDLRVHRGLGGKERALEFPQIPHGRKLWHCTCSGGLPYACGRTIIDRTHGWHHLERSHPDGSGDEHVRRTRGRYRIPERAACAGRDSLVSRQSWS